MRSQQVLCALAALTLGTGARAGLPPAMTGDLYVSDWNNDRVAVYAAGGAFLRGFTAAGLNGPRGVVFGPGREIFVASELSHEILVFDQDEQYVRRFTNAALSGPTGMALGPDSTLYVSSFNNGRICVFGTDGTFLRWFSAPGFGTPNCVAFDSAGFLYAASAGTGRVFKFDSAETFLFSFTTPVGTPLSSPMGIARTASDVLIVAGGGSSNLVRFATDGSFLGQITHPDLTGPQGIGIDERGHVFSSSYFQNKLVEFDPAGTWVQTISSGGLNVPRSIAFAPFEAGSFPAFCFGDGSASACPCGNAGAPGAGCANSATAGGMLSATGAASVSADTVVLAVAGLPPTAPGLYFQGTGRVNAGLGNAFGDGLRCAGGSVVRLGTKPSSAGTSSYPGAGDASVSTRGMLPAAGGTRTYQVWYRNVASFCTPDAFNLTNGVEIAWGA